MEKKLREAKVRTVIRTEDEVFFMKVGADKWLRYTTTDYSKTGVKEITTKEALVEINK